jgi:hypothetical protein
MVDAAQPDPGVDPRHFKSIGVEGSGTDPREGRERFNENYFESRSALNALVLDLFNPDPALTPATPPREALRVVIVAGCGGTSGGGLHPAITLVNDVLQERRVEDPRVEVWLLGPDMATGDASRQVIDEQRRMVRATSASNLVRISGEMNASGTLIETRPDGSTFPIIASRRVHSLTFIDRGNGAHDHALTGSLAAMTADALYLQLFTQAGSELAQRRIDYVRLLGADANLHDSHQ